MANIQQKSEKITTFGGIFFVFGQIRPYSVSSVIDDPNKKNTNKLAGIGKNY